MPRRDPSTGQYVAGDGGSVNEYWDVEAQHVQTRLHLNAADLPGAFPVAETIPREVANGLNRSEEARLVMLRLHGFHATVPGTASAENVLEPSWELSLDANPQTQGAENSLDSDTAAVLRDHTSDKPDILFFTHQSAEGGFGDSTTGTGAGADTHVVQDTLHFPSAFGSGPEVSGRDNLYEHWNLGQSPGATISDSEVDCYANYSLYWAVEGR